MAVCSSCGSEVSDSSNFCTSCGQPMAKAQPAQVAMPTSAAAPPPTAQASPFCTSCGAKIEPGIQFCTGCGAPVAAGESTPRSVAEPAVEQTIATPLAAIGVELAAPQIDPAAEDVPKQTTDEPALPGTQPSYPAPSTYPQDAYPPSVYSQTQQPSGGKFGLVVFILLIIIVGGAVGGWYFWGVETIVVCSPPDVTVFLDDRQVGATSYGRYVIPHLSRRTHLLRVQKPGFADTIEKLDFPLSSSREWVNIRLVPSRQIRR